MPLRPIDAVLYISLIILKLLESNNEVEDARQYKMLLPRCHLDTAVLILGAAGSVNADNAILR